VLENTAWFVVPFPLIGLVAGIIVGVISYLLGFGFPVPAMVCVAAGAALPYYIVLQQIRGTDRPYFMVVSAILAGLIITLIALGHLMPALIGAVLASAWPAYFFFKTWDPWPTPSECENRWSDTFAKKAGLTATARWGLSA